MAAALDDLDATVLRRQVHLVLALAAAVVVVALAAFTYEVWHLLTSGPHAIQAIGSL